MEKQVCGKNWIQRVTNETEKKERDLVFVSSVLEKLLSVAHVVHRKYAELQVFE